MITEKDTKLFEDVGLTVHWDEYYLQYYCRLDGYYIGTARDVKYWITNNEVDKFFLSKVENKEIKDLYVVCISVKWYPVDENTLQTAYKILLSGNDTGLTIPLGHDGVIHTHQEPESMIRNDYSIAFELYNSTYRRKTNYYDNSLSFGEHIGITHENKGWASEMVRQYQYTREYPLL